MFAVFEDVQRGVYKRSSLTAANGGEKKSKPDLHIDGPLEIKGTACNRDFNPDFLDLSFSRQVK